MHPCEIEMELRKLRLTKVGIGKQLGVTDGAVHNVIVGRRTSLRIALHIAELIGRDIDDVWPGRYAHRIKQAAA